LRRGFFVALTILCTLPTSTQARELNTYRPLLQGQTIDEQGQVIPYVSLIIKNTGVFLLSDENGQFSYSAPLAEDDSIMVQRIGYENIIFSARELFSSHHIRLTPSVIDMQPVEVEVDPSSNHNLSQLGQHTKTRGSAATNHQSMLSRIPGISIKSYGGPAGISTLSMDGGPSSHTMVLFNGIDISSSQNGESDLSQLPLPVIESMSYIPYDISQTGSGGIDGVIKLEAGDQQTHLNVSQGSFGHQAVDMYLNKQIAGFWGSIQVGQRQEKGNYPVTWDGISRSRKNNQLNQRFAAMTLRKMIRSDIYWQLTAMSSHQSRGVAGVLWSPDTISHRNDQLTLLGSTLGWIRPRGSTHLNMSARNSDDHYTNPYLDVNSDHHVQTYQVNLEDSRQIWNRLELDTELIYNLDQIQSVNTSNHKRSSFNASLAPTLQLIKNIRVTPTIKYHSSPGLYDQLLHDIQLYLPLAVGPLTQIALSYGEVYKYPSFNDLYWEPGGNPALKPEETDVTTLQSRFDLGLLGSLNLQWQKKASHNLIQWTPVLSYWQPGNVQSADRESSKLLWQIDFPHRGFSAYAHTASIYTQDHDRQRPLRYAPNQTSALGIHWTPAQFEFNVQYHYVSDRISMYSWPEDVMIDATGLWSGSVAHTWFGNMGHVTLILSAENLEATSYETIRGYPEPGRSFKISMKFSR